MNERGFGVLRPRSARRTARGALGAALGALVGMTLAATTLAAPATATTAQPRTAVAVAASPALATSTYEERVHRLVNQRRASHNLRRLRLASCADRVAEEWSVYLANNDLFLHRSMTEVLTRCDATYAGETLGRGTMSPRRLVRMWMQSPGHRAVLLSGKSRRIGVGATPDSTGRWVVAANFIRF